MNKSSISPRKYSSFLDNSNDPYPQSFLPKFIKEKKELQLFKFQKSGSIEHDNAEEVVVADS